VSQELGAEIMDHRDLVGAPPKFLRELQTGHRGHQDVNDKTAGSVGMRDLQKARRRRIVSTGIRSVATSRPQRLAHPFVIVDNVDRRLRN